MQNTIKKFGTYSGLIGAVLFFCALYFLQGLSDSIQVTAGYATIVTALLFIFFGIKHYRDKENGGIVSFGKALLIGILISLFTAIAFALVDYIYSTSINPKIVTDYIENTKSDQTPAAMSVIFALFMFAIVLVIGFIISLISALILQRKN